MQLQILYLLLFILWLFDALRESLGLVMNLIIYCYYQLFSISVHGCAFIFFSIFSELFSFPGPHEFDFVYYLAQNNRQLQGKKCKVCSQHLGANQPYCQRCLPAKINQKDHHKREIDHKFEMLKTANSHIYSEAVLLVACGGNNKDILRGYLSIPKFITPQACHWDLPECTKCDGSTSNLENDFKERYETKHYHCSQPVLVDSDAVLFYIYIHRGLYSSEC